MPPFLAALATWLFASEPAPVSWKSPGRLASRWLFLRALGLIFFSAFDSLVQQVQGLIGTDGVLPARWYLSIPSVVVHHLLRLGSRQNPRRRSGVARPYGHG